MIITKKPHLGADECILLEIPDIEVKNKLFRLILTNRRLILNSEINGSSAPTEIPLPVITSAAPGVNIPGEATLSLSIKAPDGSDGRIRLTFSDFSNKNRINERDRLQYEIESAVSRFQNNSKKTENTEQSFADPGYNNSSGDFNSGLQNRRYPHAPPFQAACINSNISRNYAGHNSSTGLIQKERHNSGNEYCQFEGLTADCSFDGTQRGNILHAPSTGRNEIKRTFGSAKTHMSCPAKRQRNTRHGSFTGGLSGGYVDTDTITGTIAGFITSPSEAFSIVKRKDISEALPVLLASLAVFAFGNAIFLGVLASFLDSGKYPALSALSDAGTIIFVALEVIIAGLIIVLLNGVLLHLAACRQGYMGKLSDSIKIPAYSAVSLAVCGLVPMLGIIIAPVWSLILQFRGAREIYPINQEEARNVVLVPVIAFGFIFVFFVTTLFLFYTHFCMNL